MDVGLWVQISDETVSLSEIVSPFGKSINQTIFALDMDKS